MHMQAGFRPPREGQETLLGSWGALAAGSFGAHLLYTRTSFAAVFPEWDALNNAILLDPPSVASASAAAAELDSIYANVGVLSWALWVPSALVDLNGADTVPTVDGMVRDISTLVMTLDLPDGLPSHPGVLETTVAVASLASDVPIPADAVPSCHGGDDIDGWVFIEDEVAVAGAWTYRAGRDVGVYAVGTAPQWRRRGLARSLMLHVLANAYRHGARTASLQSTRMGEPLYRSLGFRPVGRYDEWVPQHAAATRPEELACVSC
jgi:GNAT superfamily N-acetyltransferase